MMIFRRCREMILKTVKCFLKNKYFYNAKKYSIHRKQNYVTDQIADKYLTG